MVTTQRISPCLWFADQAEEAAKYYVGIFKNSRITTVTRYGEAGKEVHGRAPGSVMTVLFELDGQSFMGLNGGPMFKFSEAISLMVNCDTQQEIDYYWDKLSAGGDPSAQACGWLKDKFGLSWQIVPKDINKFYTDETSAGAARTMNAMLKMKKLDMGALQRAFEGKA
jgi:predicted 3-demethylubiquinone-9 3-methyltransferase (glyoxalase superfamily)